jgi:hypothetical protein
MICIRLPYHFFPFSFLSLGVASIVYAKLISTASQLEDGYLAGLDCTRVKVMWTPSQRLQTANVRHDNPPGQCAIHAAADVRNESGVVYGARQHFLPLHTRMIHAAGR